VIERVSVDDVGPFRSFSAELTGRSVGIVGPNGSGKSTILRSLAYAVTGDASCFQRRAAVRLGRDPGGPQPGVSISMPGVGSHGVVVDRRLPDGKRTGRHRLTSGNTVLDTHDAIEEWFTSTFGMSSTQAREILFVDQGSVTDVVAASPTKRAETLQKVFGVDRIVKKRELVVDYLRALPDRTRTEADDAVESMAAAERSRLSDLRARLAAVPDVDASAYESACRTVYGAKRRESLCAARDSILTRMSVNEARMAAAESEMLGIDRSLFDVDLNGMYRASIRCRQWSQSADVLRGRIADLSVPQPRDEQTRPVSELRADLGRHSYRASAVPGVPHTCQTCYSSVTFGADEIAGSAAEVDRLNEELRAASEVSARAERIAALTSELRDHIGARPDPFEGTDPDELVRLMSRVEADRARWTGLLASASSMLETDASLRGQLRDIEADAAAENTGPSLEAARALMSEYESAQIKRAELTARIRDCEASLVGIEESVRRSRSELAAAARTARQRAVLGEVVDLLHRDVLPAALVSAALTDLTTTVNDRLSVISADYRIAIDADGEIHCRFGDGSADRPAALLSPGQQMALSIAWRVAFVDRWCPGAGIVCFDEPTTGLDAARVSALRSAIGSWNSSGDGPKFVVVTHDTRLCDAFDTVISL
jgi:DNA repair exonuclease SbcCD ATPase subunit